MEYSGRRERRELHKGNITSPLSKPKPKTRFQPHIYPTPPSWVKKEAET